MGATERGPGPKRLRRFQPGGFAVVVDLFAEDVVWHFPGSSKLAGRHVGRDATLGVLGAPGFPTQSSRRRSYDPSVASRRVATPPSARLKRLSGWEAFAPQAGRVTCRGHAGCPRAGPDERDRTRDQWEPGRVAPAPG
jgi:hypothetical protein